MCVFVCVRMCTCACMYMCARVCKHAVCIYLLFSAPALADSHAAPVVVEIRWTEVALLETGVKSG